VVGLTGTACAAWPWLAAWEQNRFAARLAAQALQSAGGATEAAVRELAGLGLTAVEPLAALAASQRGDVAGAAQNALADQLAAWEVAVAEQGDVEAFAQRLRALSGALAAHAAEFGGAGRRWAQRLTRRMVAHSEQLPAADAWDVLARCEAVLAVPAAPAAPREPPVMGGEPSPQQPSTPPPVLEPPPPPRMADQADDARPLAELSVLEPPPASAGTATANRNVGNAVAPVNPLRRPGAAAAAPAEPAPDVEAPWPADAGSAPPPAIVDVPSPQELRRLTQALRELSDRDLAARAEASDKYEALASRRLLRHRGYSESLIEFTRRLERMPAAERRAAIGRAASLPAAEVRRLLRWFVADADAEVRLQALTLLATTGDPKLPEIARRRAAEDDDPRVAELATKLMKQR
jgi:hypothetical protein